MNIIPESVYKASIGVSDRLKYLDQHNGLTGGLVDGPDIFYPGEGDIWTYARRLWKNPDERKAFETRHLGMLKSCKPASPPRKIFKDCEGIDMNAVKDAFKKNPAAVHAVFKGVDHLVAFDGDDTGYNTLNIDGVPVGAYFADDVAKAIWNNEAITKAFLDQYNKIKQKQENKDGQRNTATTEQSERKSLSASPEGATEKKEESTGSGQDEEIVSGLRATPNPHREVEDSERNGDQAEQSIGGAEPDVEGTERVVEGTERVVEEDGTDASLDRVFACTPIKWLSLDLTKQELKVLIALASWAKGQPRYPEVKVIAARAGMGHRKVYEVLKSLKVKGIIDMEKKLHPKSKDMMVTFYEIKVW